MRGLAGSLRRQRSSAIWRLRAVFSPCNSATTWHGSRTRGGSTWLALLNLKAVFCVKFADWASFCVRSRLNSAAAELPQRADAAESLCGSRGG